MTQRYWEPWSDWRRTARWSLLAAAAWTLYSLPLFAQVSVVVQLSENETHTTTITNKEIRRLSKVTLSVMPFGDAVWDQFDRVSGPTFTIAPVVGANADGAKATQIVLTTLADKDSAIVATGDIDSSAGVSGISMAVVWENGVTGACQMSRTGSTPNFTWNCVAPPGSSIPPSPIQTGGPVHLEWTNPVQNVDGSPYTNPAGIKVYWGTIAGTYSGSTTISNPVATAYDVLNLPLGVLHYFAVTAFSSLNEESEFSNVVSFTPVLTNPIPVPPVGLVASGPSPVQTAYTISTVMNAMVIVSVGTVALGTPCDGTQKINAWGDSVDAQIDLYLIPTGANGLQLLPGVQPDVVYARCAAP